MIIDPLPAYVRNWRPTCQNLGHDDDGNVVFLITFTGPDGTHVLCTGLRAVPSLNATPLIHYHSRNER